MTAREWGRQRGKHTTDDGDGPPHPVNRSTILKEVIVSVVALLLGNVQELLDVRVLNVVADIVDAVVPLVLKSPVATIPDEVLEVFLRDQNRVDGIQCICSPRRYSCRNHHRCRYRKLHNSCHSTIEKDNYGPHWWRAS